MKEAQYILQSVTTRSLVILDELCRHTTVEEGSAIAWSICERLSLTTAFTFAATHFLHLTALSDMYYNVTTYVKVLQEMYLYLLSEKKRTIIKIANRRFRHCFETTTTETEGSSELHLIYTHKLSYGTGITDHYGIALAEVSSLPRCVTAKAREYASLQSIVSSIRAANVQIFISMQ